jgi:phage FluMu gp28-like protein
MSAMPINNIDMDTAEALEELPPGDLLLGYQQELLTTVSEIALTVVEKSRRIGATWALAADAVLRAGATREAKGMNVMYISYAMDMTREFVDAAAVFAKIFSQGLTSIDEYVFKDKSEDGDKDINAFRINFASGFKIQALSSAPRSLRGKQGLVIIDEAAFVDNLSELVKAAMAMVIWGAKVVVISTHNGVDNPFNRLLDDVKAKRQKGLHLKITFQDAIDDGLYERICLMKGEAPTPEGKVQFVEDVRGYYGKDAGEELDVVPSAGGGSWISPAHVSTATTDDSIVGPLNYLGGFCYVGWDVARKKDLSVITVYEDVNGVLVQREVIVMEGWTFKRQHAEFDRVMERYRVARANIDETGLGMAVCEDAQERHGSTRVHGISFTAASKLEMATIYRERYEEETIQIGEDPLLRSDILSIKKSGGSSGVPVFANDNETDGHGDRFWSGALAATGARIGYMPYAYHPAGRGSANNADARGRRVKTTSGLRGTRGTY